ncbi:CD209 antigen-like protein D isoform X2 [Ctenopharyngodon idella]|uniref:CD209 antigen-like protein D isoform X1 n=2 Tax=Ctenopharyngodon idella TaxID=7959 RepID=UPI00222FFA8D|nr:CD209 antigen-like protein D isoform X1 [Ctenopharyngodon idella]XP_051763538.1 CD209 antigen-like protein D isoform X2 [Ctenopharyngodon idella]
MSDGIYDNVIKTESEGMKTERVEMMVEIYESVDCVGDHDFRTETNIQQPPECTESDSVRIRSSRAALVCLVLLCVLLLTAVIVLCVYIHSNSSTNYTEETHQLLTNITNLIEERDQLLNKITNLTEERDGLIIKNKNLNERDRLRNELQICAVWTCYQSSIYYISNETKNWTESRRYCTDRGADLIIINNREEQEFLKRVPGGTEVWIGLTDSDVEDTWKWVDGTNMTSGFWRDGEPSDSTGEEDCAINLSSGFADYSCNENFKWICEKNTF